MNFQEIGISAGNWGDSAQDRNYWRALVNAALNSISHGVCIYIYIYNYNTWKWNNFSLGNKLGQTRESSWEPLDQWQQRYQ